MVSEIICIAISPQNEILHLMRYLGIDFGSKRVGLSLSDIYGRMAFPHSVIENTEKLIDEVVAFIRREEVTAVVLGESRDFGGEPNKIMKQITEFKLSLESRLEHPVIFQNEVLTSREAMHIQGDNALNDASAAAIILQSYLDRINRAMREEDEDSDEGI